GGVGAGYDCIARSDVSENRLQIRTGEVGAEGSGNRHRGMLRAIRDDSLEAEGNRHARRLTAGAPVVRQVERRTARFGWGTGLTSKARSGCTCASGYAEITRVELSEFDGPRRLGSKGNEVHQR